MLLDTIFFNEEGLKSTVDKDSIPRGLLEKIACYCDLCNAIDYKYGGCKNGPGTNTSPIA